MFFVSGVTIANRSVGNLYHSQRECFGWCGCSFLSWAPNSLHLYIFIIKMVAVIICFLISLLFPEFCSYHNPQCLQSAGSDVWFAEVLGVAEGH